MEEDIYVPVKTNKTPTLGRPKKIKKKAQAGQGRVFQPRLYRESSPSIMALMSCRTAAELREQFGIILPDDLVWAKSDSEKTFALLTALARRGDPKQKDRSLKFVDKEDEN